MEPLSIQLLGEFRVCSRGQVLNALDTRLVRSFLALLLLRGSVPLSRQEIADQLWSEDEVVDPRHRLREHLSALRKAFREAGVDPDRFILDDKQHGTLQWNSNAPCSLDVVNFERLASPNASLVDLKEAATLYKKDLDPGIYGEWIVAESERLRERFLLVLERIIRGLEEQGDYVAAASYAERLRAHDPTREETYLHLMRLAAKRGDRAMVLHYYQACLGVLKRDFGMEPGPALKAEYARWSKYEPAPASETAGHKIRSSNLPFQVTSFVGREQELAEIEHLVGFCPQSGAGARLVTLSGIGGSGKTRLALEFAHHMLTAQDPDCCPEDGVWLVELAPLSEPSLLPHTIAFALGVQEQQGRPLLDTLVDWLRPKELLLILDNCEHLVAACAELATRLLTSCPDITLLTTSQARLNVNGEIVREVKPLSLPSAADLEDPERLNRSDAIRLFTDRASAILPTFGVTPQNVRAVAQVCQQLDGIPLALELAAVLIRAMPAEQLARRLDDRFRLLSRGSRTAPQRQQTLRAMMDWSWDLLSKPECALLQRMSVLRGGGTLEAVEAICSDEEVQGSQILKVLTSLIDRSLVDVRERSGEARYVLLEVVREYAWGKLVDAGESEQGRQQHLRFYLELAEEAEPQLDGAEQLAWLNRLESENDNLRAALAWSQSALGDLTAGLNLAGALWRFWWQRGYFYEGRERLAALLRKADQGPAAPAGERAGALARAFQAAGILAYYQGDYAEASKLWEESLALRRQLGDDPGIASLLNALGSIAAVQGDYAGARAFYESNLGVRQRLGDRTGIAVTLTNLALAWQDEGKVAEAEELWKESLNLYRELGIRRGEAWSLIHLGDLRVREGRYERARPYLDQGLTIYRELENSWGEAYALHYLGRLERAAGDSSQALSLYRSCLKLFSTLGDKFGIVEVLESSAAVLRELGQPERGAFLLGASQRIRDGANLRRAPSDRGGHRQVMEAIRRELGEEVFQASWTGGEEAGIDKAIAYALDESSSAGPG